MFYLIKSSTCQGCKHSSVFSHTCIVVSVCLLTFVMQLEFVFMDGVSDLYFFILCFQRLSVLEHSREKKDLRERERSPGLLNWSLVRDIFGP